MVLVIQLENIEGPGDGKATGRIATGACVVYPVGHRVTSAANPTGLGGRPLRDLHDDLIRVVAASREELVRCAHVVQSDKLLIQPKRVRDRTDASPVDCYVEMTGAVNVLLVIDHQA